MASVRQAQGPRRSSLRGVGGRRTKAEALATADKHAGALVARFMASRRIKKDILQIQRDEEAQDEPCQQDAILPVASNNNSNNSNNMSRQRDSREQVAAVVLTRLYIDGLQDQERRERERFVKVVTSCAEPPAPLVALPNMEQTAYMLETWDADEEEEAAVVAADEAVAARAGNDEAAAIAAAILLNQARAGSAVPSESDSVPSPASPHTPAAAAAEAGSSGRSASVSSMVSMTSMTSTASTATTVSLAEPDHHHHHPMTRMDIDRLVHQATASSVADSMLPRPSPPPKTAYDAWARAIAVRPSWAHGYFAAVPPAAAASAANTTTTTTTTTTHTVQHGMPSPPQSPTELGSWPGNGVQPTTTTTNGQQHSEMQQQMKLMQQQMQREQRQRHKQQQLQLQQQQQQQQLPPQHLPCPRQLPLPPALRTAGTSTSTSTGRSSHAPAGLPTPPPSFTASMHQQQHPQQQQQRPHHLLLPPPSSSTGFHFPPPAAADGIATTIVTLPPVSTTTAAAGGRRGDLLTPVSPRTTSSSTLPHTPGSSPRGSPRVAAAAAAAAADKRDRQQRQQQLKQRPRPRPRQHAVSSASAPPASAFSSFSSVSSFSSTPSSASATTAAPSPPKPRAGPAAAAAAASLSRPHCNVKYETAELDFILYQRTTKNRAWDDVTAAFNAALPRLRPYADRERGDREARGDPRDAAAAAGAAAAAAAAAGHARPRPERTTPGLQASYYRQRLALPLLDAAGRLVFDDASGKQLFTEVMVRDDKSRKKSLRRLAATAATAATTPPIPVKAAATTTTTAPEDTRVHLVLYFPERVAYYDYWFVSEEDKALARQRAYERNLQRTQRGLPPWHPGCDDPETGILIRGKDAA